MRTLPPPPSVRTFLLAALFLFVSPGVHAQISFTFTGNVVSADYVDGYSVGDTISVTFVSHATTAAPVAFGPYMGMSWKERLVEDPVLFSDVTFTGATGQWSRPVYPTPTEFGEGPTSFLGVSAWPSVFSTSAAADVGLYTGLLAGGHQVIGVSVAVHLTPPIFQVPGDGYPDIQDYFSSYAGTYDVTIDDYNVPQIVLEHGYAIEFAPSTLTISAAPTAIPEPSTYAMLVGSVVLSAVVLRRGMMRKDV